MINKKPLLKVLTGSLAGAVATVPMTCVMEFLHRWPYPERNSLPPEQITSIIAARIGLKQKVNRNELLAISVGQHFAFGGAMGKLYAMTTARTKCHPTLKGSAWGLMVWGISYLGWLPMAEVLPTATQNSKRRNFIMITAHLVWGVTLALLLEGHGRSKNG